MPYNPKPDDQVVDPTEREQYGRDDVQRHEQIYDTGYNQQLLPFGNGFVHHHIAYRVDSFADYAPRKKVHPLLPF
jgi:hypothetical protein